MEGRGQGGEGWRTEAKNNSLIGSVTICLVCHILGSGCVWSCDCTQMVTSQSIGGEERRITEEVRKNSSHICHFLFVRKTNFLGLTVFFMQLLKYFLSDTI